MTVKVNIAKWLTETNSRLNELQLSCGLQEWGRLTSLTLESMDLDWLAFREVVTRFGIDFERHESFELDLEGWRQNLNMRAARCTQKLAVAAGRGPNLYAECAAQLTYELAQIVCGIGVLQVVERRAIEEINQSGEEAHPSAAPDGAGA